MPIEINEEVARENRMRRFRQQEADRILSNQTRFESGNSRWNTVMVAAEPGWWAVWLSGEDPKEVWGEPVVGWHLEYGEESPGVTEPTWGSAVTCATGDGTLSVLGADPEMVSARFLGLWHERHLPHDVRAGFTPDFNVALHAARSEARGE